MIIQYPILLKAQSMGFKSPPKAREPLKVAGRLAQFIDTWKVLTGDTCMGIEYHKRVCNSSEREALAESKTLRRGILKRTNCSSKRRDKIIIREGCHLPLQGDQRFLLMINHFSSSQKEWSDEASNQFEASEPLGGISSFQDGGYPNIAGPHKTRGLDGEGRSEGCILHHPNSSPLSTTFEVCGRESPVSIHLSPLRSFMCPMGIHKSDEAIDGTAEVMGSPNNNIYRRHANLGSDQGGGNTTLRSSFVPSRSSGFHDQLREVTHEPNTGNRIPWADYRLTESSTQAAGRKDKADSQGGSPTAIATFCVSSSAFSVPGQTQCSLSGNVGCSLVLSGPAEGSPENPIKRSSGLRVSSGVLKRVSRRANLVANSPYPMEREDSDSEASSNSDSVRCVSSWLGGSMQQSEHRRLMVPKGADDAYQLLRAPCSRSGSENLSQRSSEGFSVTATGQLHGSGLHKQPRRDSVTISHFASEDPVALGPGEGHSPYSPTHSRYIQCGSGSGIQIGAGQVGLDAGTRSVPENQSNIWPTGSGPICHSLDSPTATFFQLEARSMPFNRIGAW